MHTWGDENVDWNGINEAAHWIGQQLRRWGRVNVMQTKEKYGRVCVYCSLGWHQLFSITHPGYARSRYPKWLWTLDCLYLSRVVRLLNCVIIPYHKWLYTRTYGRALKKWPHLRSEILHGADNNDLLRKYGVHLIRTGVNSYEVRYDWHPDNFVYPPQQEDDLP